MNVRFLTDLVLVYRYLLIFEFELQFATSCSRFPNIAFDSNAYIIVLNSCRYKLF